MLTIIEFFGITSYPDRKTVVEAVVEALAREGIVPKEEITTIIYDASVNKASDKMQTHLVRASTADQQRLDDIIKCLERTLPSSVRVLPANLKSSGLFFYIICLVFKNEI